MRIGDTAAPTVGNQQTEPPSNELNKDDFLRLLTTQLAQQDPLSPMDNQAFVGQLSQMASVERLENVASSIETLAMAQSANTSAQLVSFIGQSIRVAGDEFAVSGGEPGEFGFELEEDAASVEVIIRDEDGEVVRTLDLGGQDSGSHDVSWDGLDKDGNPVEDGDFTFEVHATNEEDEKMASSSWSMRTVEGVSFKGGFPRLMLKGGGDAPIGDVMEVIGSSSSQ